MLAAGVDAVAAAALALLLSQTPVGVYFSARAVVLLRIGEPDTWFQGPVALIIGLLGQFVFVLPCALVLVLLPEAVWGWASGKRVFGLRIGPTAAAGRLAGRYLIKSAPLWLSVLALATGLWVLQATALVAAAGLIASWIIDGLRRRPQLHDRLAGTTLDWAPSGKARRTSA